MCIRDRGKIRTFGNDDFRFQLTVGEPGRYSSAGLTPDIVVDPTSGETVVEETTAYTLAYKHHWNDTVRSTAYYGTAKTETLGRERTHWAVNLLADIRKGLTVGAELGNFSITDEGIDDIDSNYLQLSVKYSL